MSKKKYDRILVVTDGLKSSEPTHESAFDLAKQHGADVLLVDTVVPPSSLNRWLSVNAGDVFEMVVADKQARLEKLAEHFRSGGVEVDTKVLFGKSSEAITRQAIEWDASLVVRYMKGVRSKYPGLLGNTARSLMRFCPAPLLLVGDKAIGDPRVLACIDTEHEEKENAAILAEAANLAQKENLFGIYCWEFYGADLIQKRMTERAFKDSLEYAESIFRASFDKFVESHDLAEFGNGVRIENGQPSVVIPEFCRHESIDVVVMCSATLNHPLKRLIGSTVESVIDELPCALLVVKPVGFVSPIRGAEVASNRT